MTPAIFFTLGAFVAALIMVYARQRNTFIWLGPVEVVPVALTMFAALVAVWPLAVLVVLAAPLSRWLRKQ